MKKDISNSALKNAHCHFIFLFVLFLLSFVNTIKVNAQWEECNNCPECLYGKINGDAVWCFAIDGNNTYIGNTVGVFMTTDNGDNWTPKNKGLPTLWNDLNIFSLAINGNYISAGTMIKGLFLSIDKGENWELKSNGLPYEVCGLDTDFLATKPVIITSGNNIFASTNKGVFLLTENGDNWIPQNNGLPKSDTLTVGVHSMAVSGKNVFAGTIHGVYMTTENGDNWFPKNNRIEDEGICSISVNGNNIYAGGGGIYLSTNNGDDWKYIGLKDTTIDEIIIKDNNIFVISHRYIKGVLLSTDNGNSWISKNSGLPSLATMSLIIKGDYIFVGVDNYGVYRAKLSDLGITDVKENEQIVNNLIYPNPASNLVKLKMKEQPGGNLQIQIVDLFGRTVYKSIENCAGQSNEKTIDCSGFPNGFYSVILSYNDKKEYLRMVINK